MAFNAITFKDPRELFRALGIPERDPAEVARIQGEKLDMLHKAHDAADAAVREKLHEMIARRK